MKQSNAVFGGERMNDNKQQDDGREAGAVSGTVAMSGKMLLWSLAGLFDARWEMRKISRSQMIPLADRSEHVNIQATST